MDGKEMLYKIADLSFIGRALYYLAFRLRRLVCNLDILGDHLKPEKEIAFASIEDCTGSAEIVL